MLSHKNFIIIFSVGMILVVGAGIWYFSLLKITEQTATNTITSQATQLGYQDVTIASDETLQQNIFTSAKYSFRLTLPKTMQYWMGSQDNALQLFSMGWTSLNANTSEQKNRNTPNGFNTSADNGFELRIYPNDQRLNSASGSSLDIWLKGLGMGDVGDPTEKIMINNRSVLRRTQADGIDSRGYFYYLFTVPYVYVFNTENFTDDEMKQFIGNFQIL